MKITECTRCHLSETRMNVVTAQKGKENGVMFIGEAPGRNEDEQGMPFVGKAGNNLNEIYLYELGLKRSDVTITNIVKCRPPKNRVPTGDEVEACLIWLRKEIEIINPCIIICLGNTSFNHMWVNYMVYEEGGRDSIVDGLKSFYFSGIPVVGILHPASIVYDPSRKKKLMTQLAEVKSLISKYRSKK